MPLRPTRSGLHSMASRGRGRLRARPRVRSLDTLQSPIVLCKQATAMGRPRERAYDSSLGRPAVTPTTVVCSKQRGRWLVAAHCHLPGLVPPPERTRWLAPVRARALDSGWAWLDGLPRLHWGSRLQFPRRAARAHGPIQVRCSLVVQFAKHSARRHRYMRRHRRPGEQVRMVCQRSSVAAL